MSTSPLDRLLDRRRQRAAHACRAPAAAARASPGQRRGVALDGRGPPPFRGADAREPHRRDLRAGALQRARRSSRAMPRVRAALERAARGGARPSRRGAASASTSSSSRPSLLDPLLVRGLVRAGRGLGPRRAIAGAWDSSSRPSARSSSTSTAISTGCRPTTAAAARSSSRCARTRSRMAQRARRWARASCRCR